MALLKNTDDLARLIKVDPQTIRKGEHYPAVAGLLSARIGAFLMFAESSKSLEDMKEHIKIAFGDLLMEGETL